MNFYDYTQQYKVMIKLRQPIACTIILAFFVLLAPVITRADTFPDEPFNGMQITYSISGASVTGFEDTWGFTTYRKLIGTLSSPGTLTVSGTVGMGNGYSADATVTVSAGGKSASWGPVNIPTGYPGMNTKSYSVSIPVAQGTETATLSIDMTGYYNAGTRGLEVLGDFAIPVPPGIKQRPDLRAGPCDNPQTRFVSSGPPQQGLPNYAVNTSLLNLVISDMDFGCQSLGLDQELRRVWSMDPTRLGMFGKGWTFAYESTLLAQPPASGGVKLTLGTGQVIEFAVKSQQTDSDYLKVDYTRTTQGIGPMLTAWLDESTGVGTYELRDEIGNQVYSYGYVREESGGHLYHLQSIEDFNGNQLSLSYDSNNRLATLTDASGRITQFSYDAYNRCTKMQTLDGKSATYEYDWYGNLTKSVDLAGNVITYTYDYDGYITAMTVAGKTTSFTYATKANKDRYLSAVTAPDGQMTRYAFNVDWSSSVTEPGGGIATYANSEGRTTSVKDPLGKVTNTILNNQFLPVKVTDALGRITTFEYDANGNLTKVINAAGKVSRYTYDAKWNLTRVTNALGHSTTYAYDSSDNLIQETSPLGRVTTYTRNAKGQVTKIILPLGNAYALSYDVHGNLTGITNPLGQKTTLSFDAVGLNPVKQRDARGNTTGFEFDANRRLTAIHRADGKSEYLEYDCCSLISEENGAGQLTRFQRDVVYRLTGVTDPLAHVSHFAYSSDGELIRATDPLGRMTDTTYDAVHRAVLLTDPLDGEISVSRDAIGNITSHTDERDRVTTLTYDPMDRLIRSTDPAGKTTARYTRDALGRITAIANARGHVVKFGYDADGRLVTKHHNGQLVASYTWDSNNALTAVTDPLGTQTLSRDATGLITKITYPGGKTSAFAYDAAGNLKTLSYPHGLIVTYTYDALNRVKTVDFAGNKLTLAYNAAGNLIQETRSNGVISTYGYDAASQLTRIRHRKGTVTIADINYTRNAAGVITQERGVWPLTAKIPAADVTASFNATNSIVKTNSEHYTHDVDGNLEGITGTRTFKALYDPENRPTSLTIGAGTTTYTYDGLGNRAQAKAGGVTQIYYHDEAGRLLTTSDSTGTVTHYLYADGRLIASGSPGKGYVFYHANQIGSTLALTNGAGTVVGAFAYDPFGKVLARSGTARTPFTFVGAYGVMEGAGNLFFMRHRYYDANTGRFIQRDPIGFAGGADNLYVYVNNNPLTALDPSGTSPIGQAILIGIGAETIGLYHSLRSYGELQIVEHKSQLVGPMKAEAYAEGLTIHVGQVFKGYSPAVQKAILAHERQHIRNRAWTGLGFFFRGDDEVVARLAEIASLEQAIDGGLPCSDMNSAKIRKEIILGSFKKDYEYIKNHYGRVYLNHKRPDIPSIGNTGPLQQQYQMRYGIKYLR